MLSVLAAVSVLELLFVTCCGAAAALATDAGTGFDTNVPALAGVELSVNVIQLHTNAAMSKILSTTMRQADNDDPVDDEGW